MENMCKVSACFDLIVLDKRLTAPEYATAGSAAFDLRAAIHNPIVIEAGETKLIGTGIKIHMGREQAAGYLQDYLPAMLLLPRSGLGHKHGIVLGNLVGLIDSDYLGEIMVSLWNRSEVSFKVEPLDRICQAMFVPVIIPKFKHVDEFVDTTRGEGGFGSTGKA